MNRPKTINILRPSGILFDLDGTLVDTSRDITANINRAFESHGYPQLPHETILSHVGFGAHFLVKSCIEVNRPDEVVDDRLVTEIWEKFRDHYRMHIIEHAQPYPGVREFLASSTVPMGVVSNKPAEFVIGVLKALDLHEHFSFIWGRDSLPVSKPDPQVIRYGIHELGISEAAQVCMVGDNAVDIISANGAGAISVAVSYGFSSRDMLEKEQPDFLFQSFPEFVAGCRLG